VPEELLRWYGPGYYTGQLRDEYGHVVGYDNYAEQGPCDAARVFSWLTSELSDISHLQVLDVGCAHGYLSRLLKTAGAQVQGVERSEDSKAQLVDASIPTHPTLHDPAIRPQSFDVIVMAEYLEHTLDPLSDLQRARSCLRPHGVLAVTVPNGSQRAVAVYGIKYHSFTAPVHLQVFTLESLRAAIRGLFVMRRCEPYCLNLQNPMPRWLLRALMIDSNQISFDGTAETYNGIGTASQWVLKIARGYRYYLRRRALEFNKGLRLILERL
jgi:SAM-dependent methyltransferase